MSGHSKWKNNLGRKTAQDTKRAVNFGKLSKAITIAVLESGSPDPSLNPRLRVAIEKARMGSMPKDNIERAIAKGSGPDKVSLKSLKFEVFGPGGVALIAIATTDNTNRTSSEVRTIVERHGGKLGQAGSVSHMFTHCAVAIIPKENSNSFDEKLLDFASKLDAIDIQSESDNALIYFPFINFGKAHELLNSTNSTSIIQLHILYQPQILVDVADDAITALDDLINSLESHDDIHEVFTNAA